MHKIINKLKIPILVISVIAILIYYLKDMMVQIVDYLDFYFLAFLMTAIQQFKLGDIGLGALCLIIQIIMYLLALLLFKVTIIDTYFPRFRVVTPDKDIFKFARKIKQTTGDDPRYAYFMVKFHLTPVLRWHKLKIPKPKYVMRGIPFINRKMLEIKDGFKDVSWRRMPASMDIITSDMHLNYDRTEQCYILGKKLEVYRADPVKPYEELAFNGIQTIGTNVIESVKGDWGLIKDQFHMGIVIREKDLPIPNKDVITDKARPELNHDKTIIVDDKKPSNKNNNIVIRKKGLDENGR